MKVMIAGEPEGLHTHIYAMLYALDFVHAVYGAEHEEEALEKARTEKIDVLLLNMGLKSGNWVRLLLEVKKEEDAPTVITLGGRAHPIVQLLCISLGADLFLDSSRESNRIPAVLSELDRRSRVRNIA